MNKHFHYLLKFGSMLHRCWWINIDHYPKSRQRYYYRLLLMNKYFDYLKKFGSMLRRYWRIKIHHWTDEKFRQRGYFRWKLMIESIWHPFHCSPEPTVHKY